MIISRLMGSGMPAALAQAFCDDLLDNQTATGTTQADALITGKGVVRVTTTASGTGVLLTNGSRGDSQLIINDGANTLAVYPPVGHTISGLSANAAYSLPAGAACYFERITNTQWEALNDAADLSFVPSGTGTITRSVQAKLREIVSVSDFSTAALADADGGSGALYVPAATTSTLATGASMTSNYWGKAQITTADSNKRAKIFSHISSAPSSLGNENSIETAFNGDWSHAQFSIEHRITGAATIGQPTSGYLYTPEAYPHYTYLYNSSGYNNSTSTNSGRTAAVAYRTQVYHHGDGDAVAFNVNGFCDSTKSGSTVFLANPAIVAYNGNLTAGADGVYLNWGEALNSDAGFDVAGIGWVLRSNRTVNTGAKSAWWAGLRVQSEGTAAIDVGVSLQGPMQIGLDTTFATLQGSGTYTSAGITMAADQRIYMHATATDSSGLSRFPSALANDYFTYSSSLSGFNFVVNNSSILQLVSGQLTAPQKIVCSSFIRAQNTTAIPAGGTQGVGYQFSTTSNFGIFFGSGTPTLSAAQGSVYLRSDGNPYLNTNGSTGWSPLVANTVTTGISAAGSVQGDATALTTTFNGLTTVTAGTGVVLKSGAAGDVQIVFNGGTNPVKVYPPSGAKINGLTTNGAMTLPINTTCSFYFLSATLVMGSLSA